MDDQLLAKRETCLELNLSLPPPQSSQDIEDHRQPEESRQASEPPSKPKVLINEGQKNFINPRLSTYGHYFPSAPLHQSAHKLINMLWGTWIPVVLLVFLLAALVILSECRLDSAPLPERALLCPCRV